MRFVERYSFARQASQPQQRPRRKGSSASPNLCTAGVTLRLSRLAKRASRSNVAIERCPTPTSTPAPSSRSPPRSSFALRSCLAEMSGEHTQCVALTPPQPCTNRTDAQASTLLPRTARWRCSLRADWEARMAEARAWAACGGEETREGRRRGGQKW